MSASSRGDTRRTAALYLSGNEWSVAPAEDFSFFDVEVSLRDRAAPTPVLFTFPTLKQSRSIHQREDVLELLLPFLSELRYGV